MVFVYLYVNNNDTVLNDNNDLLELLELLISKHWRMSDWSIKVIKVETSLPVDFLTIFLDSHFLALLVQMFEEVELKLIHCCKKREFFILVFKYLLFIWHGNYFQFSYGKKDIINVPGNFFQSNGKRTHSERCILEEQICSDFRLLNFCKLQTQLLKMQNLLAL